MAKTAVVAGFFFLDTMDEPNISAGETSAAAESANVAGAETAQPTETPVSTPETSQPTETATETFSAGWSLDDDAQPETEAELTDEQIAELTQDPTLDQAKVPGLVQKLRDAWTVGKQQKAELASLRQQIAQFEQYGGVEGAGQMAGLASGLIADPQQGVTPFLQTLWEKAQPAYQGIADALVEHEANYLIQRLQAEGKLPDAPQTVASDLTADDWARIPEELRDIAKQIPTAELINWLDNNNDATLKMLLSNQKELGELKGADRARAEQAQRQEYQQARQQGQQAITELSGQYEKSHMEQLSKWQPFGPQAGEQNQQLYGMVLRGALDRLLADEQWAKIRSDAVTALEQAPLRRLRGEHMAADADERNARALAFRFNTRLGQIMKDMIKHPQYGLDSVFRDARAYRDSQRQDIPNRTEISGQSTQTGRNGSPPTLKNGKTNPAYLDWLAAQLPTGQARQG